MVIRSARAIALENDLNELNKKFEELQLEIKTLIEDCNQGQEIIHSHDSRFPSDDPALMSAQQLDKLYEETLGKHVDARFKMEELENLSDKIDKLNEELKEENIDRPTFCSFRK